jgi:hypothetical protein
MSHEFVEAVRAGDWPSAHALIRQGRVSPSLPTPSTSVYTWLAELNAPPAVVVDLVRVSEKPESADGFTSDLMETCLRESTTKANAFETFALLLSHGVDPNQMSVFGRESSTNLQEARRIGNEAATIVLASFKPSN